MRVESRKANNEESLWKKLDKLKFSVDEIRAYSGYEHLTDEQASEMADFLALYAQVVFNSIKK